jgi:predicted secreted protein
MAASNAWWAYGSTFKLGDGATEENFTAVAEVRDITGPNMTRASIDVTNQDSDDGWRESIPGFRDGDVVTVSANWLPSNATQDGTTGLFSHFEDDDNHNYQIVTPAAVGITISFAGHITRFPLSFPLEAQAQLEFDVKVSGAVSIDES